VAQVSRPSERALLAPTAEEDLHTRLQQAADRAAFLANVARTLSGSLQTVRAVDLVLELLVGPVVGPVVDWAQIAVRDRRVFRCRSRTAEGTGEVAEVPVTAVAADSAFARVLATGVSDLAFVPDADNAASRGLDSTVPAEEMRFTLADVRPIDMLSLPLSARGTTYGVLTVARRAGQGFDQEGVKFLEDFADRVSLPLDTTRALAESRRVASVLTRDLTPPSLPELAGAEFSAYYRVAFESEAVGGDFYDVNGGDDAWTAVVGDVCGKGVEAAVLTGRVRQSVRTAALVDRSPGRVLDLVNRVLIGERDDSFVTAVCARGRHDGRLLHLDLAAAGHPEPVVVRNDGTVEQIAVGGMVLGLFDVGYYAEVSLTLEPGEPCLLFTDGVLEAPGYRERFGDARLHDLLVRTGPMHASALVETIAMSLSRHVGDRAHDDIAILAIQAAPAAEPVENSG
jgi:sigma-B regulation protein RsbU (phosphoserine phosphatase)